MSHHENGISTSTVLVSFLAGAALGAGLALLYAPKSGREMRDQIGDLADDAASRIKEYTRDAQDKIRATMDEGKEMLREKKTIISSAIEAGKEAIQKEREKFGV